MAIVNPEKKHSLFRSAALEARFSRRGSAIMLTTPLSGRIVAVISLIVAVVLLSISLWGHLTRTVTVSGALVPERGVIRIFSPQLGIITEKRFAFGDRVVHGQALYRLSSDRSSASGSALIEEISAAYRNRISTLTKMINTTASLHQVERARLLQQQKDMRSEIIKISAQTDVQSETVNLDQNIVDRKITLQRSGITPIDQVETYKRQLWYDRAQLLAWEIDSLKLNQTLADISKQLEELPLNQENQINDLERQLAQAEADLAENEMRREITISSPEDGTVSADLAEAGQTVTTGTPMAVIAPENANLEAHLLVPSSGIGFVHTGATVALRYQAFPYQKFGVYGGHVRTISEIALTSAEMEALHVPMTTNEPIYRVTVALDQQSAVAFGENQPLRAGMLVDAEIDAESRYVWEWIFEPVYSLRGSSVFSGAS